MHRYFAQICLGILLFLNSASVALAKPFHVLIDPGHGGADRGAVRGKFIEADLALKIAKKLSARLDSTYDVSLTRVTDVLVPLHRRSEMAREVEADVFVSIHANASVDPRAEGVEIYLQNQLPADEESMYLANLENQSQNTKDAKKSQPIYSSNIDVNAIVLDLYRNHRFHQSAELAKSIYQKWPRMRSPRHAVRQAPFFVISQTDAPAILIEVGYLSHASEGARLYSEEFQNQLVAGLAEGIESYRAKISK